MLAPCFCHDHNCEYLVVLKIDHKAYEPLPHCTLGGKVSIRPEFHTAKKGEYEVFGTIMAVTKVME